MKTYTAYYRKLNDLNLTPTEAAEILLSGDPDLTVEMVKDGDTHLPVRTLDADSIDHVFKLCQGEFWTPTPEEIERIEEVLHTSMSVGDVVYEHETGKFHQVDTEGWKEVLEEWKLEEQKEIDRVSAEIDYVTDAVKHGDIEL